MTAEFGFSVSVVIPVYNGFATVGEVVERSREVLGPLVGDLEFVLVNDGSADKTARWIGKDAVRELTSEKTLARLR